MQGRSERSLEWLEVRELLEIPRDPAEDEVQVEERRQVDVEIAGDERAPVTGLESEDNRAELLNELTGEGTDDIGIENCFMGCPVALA